MHVCVWGGGAPTSCNRRPVTPWRLRGAGGVFPTHPVHPHRCPATPSLSAPGTPGSWPAAPRPLTACTHTHTHNTHTHTVSHNGGTERHGSLILNTQCLCASHLSSFCLKYNYFGYLLNYVIISVFIYTISKLYTLV